MLNSVYGLEGGPTFGSRANQKQSKVSIQSSPLPVANRRLEQAPADMQTLPTISIKDVTSYGKQALHTQNSTQNTKRGLGKKETRSGSLVTSVQVDDDLKETASFFNQQ